MNLIFVIALAGLTFSCGSIQAAQTASGRMYCLSVRFNKANAGGPHGLYSLDFTGIEYGINGELYPVSGASRSHYTTLILTDDLFEEDYPGSLLLDVPETDSDGDGFPDIFDTAKAFSGASSGTYSLSGYGSGNASVSWSRSADSRVGICQLHLQNFGTFTYTFNILEYRGPLTYTSGTNLVEANVNLTLTGVADSELKGPITFQKTSGDPYNDLTFAAGAWTNFLSEPTETYSFLSDVLSRDAAWPTNYYGYFEFDDWLPSTSEPDYYLWVLSIDDPNDSDADGIPDFSDDPQISTRAPIIGLSRAQNTLQLSISGNIGDVCHIQQSSTVDASNWPTVSSVTLTDDPQTVSLPLPSGEASFWRIKIQ